MREGQGRPDRKDKGVGNKGKRKKGEDADEKV